MESLIIEGTLEEVQRELSSLPFAPNQRLKLELSTLEESKPSPSPFAPSGYRNGVPLLPFRKIEPMGADFVRQLMDEEDAEFIRSNRTAGY